MSSSKPSSREEFKEYCLRQLGSPILEINVTDDQIEDAIDNSISYFTDYHYDGSFLTYMSHQITQDTLNNKYIEVPDNVIGVNRILPINSLSSSSDVFSVGYQLSYDLVMNMSADTGLVPYYTTRMQYAQLEELLVGQTPIRFNRHMNKVYLDTSKTKINAGGYIVIEMYISLNETSNTDMWNDRWLKRYCTEQIRKIWGSNMSKFTIQLVGGVSMNGREILEDAKTEIEKLEAEMLVSYSLPPTDIIL